MLTGEIRLADAAPGQAVEFRAFDASLALALRDQFLAYGLLPGQSLQVLQQHPLTVFLCGHTELAVETAVAGSMIVAARTA